MINSPILQLNNINKSYIQGDRVLHILKDVCFTVNKGDMVALVGPSGCGKSTLLQIAGLLDNAESGERYIDQINYSNASDKVKTAVRNKKIGFIYQFHHLLAEFTALENVIIPQIIAGIDKKQAVSNAKEMLEKFGLSARIQHLPSELSGGEQQRVAIARALINKPSLLLADEPTGNLDPYTSAQVFDILLNAVQEQNLATLIVTHNLELAGRMNRQVSLVNGEITKSL